jgi:hypothetical protein
MAIRWAAIRRSAKSSYSKIAVIARQIADIAAPGRAAVRKLGLTR